MKNIKFTLKFMLIYLFIFILTALALVGVLSIMELIFTEPETINRANYGYF
jgi:hypothetical protein